MSLIWFAVRVRAGREAIIADFLERVGNLTVFLPLELKWRRYNRIDRRRRQVAYPLLPRYLFVAFAGAEPIPWQDLFRFDIVSSVVGNNGIPRPIPEEAMQNVRNLSANAAGGIPTTYELPKVKAGDRVTIKEGPLSGQNSPVVVQRVKGRKAWLLLEKPFLGQREAEVSVDQLEAAQ